jgi:GNAT superfamily N-acetyltransferase
MNPPGSGPQFRPLLPGEVPSALRLSRLAGWNQTEADWERLVRLNPAGVCVWRDQEEVRASFSVTPYQGTQRIGWIGMILVDPAFRNRGIGSAALAAALHHIREQGLDLAGLDATDLGEPVYRKHGFVSIRPMTRWRGRLKFGGGPLPDSPCVPPPLEAVAAFDQRCSGVDRSPLFHHLLQSGARLLALKEETGDLAAFGFLRPGREAWQLGPVVAPRESRIPQLFDAVVQLVGEGNECLCDVPDGAIPQDQLRAVGMEASRHLQRMTLPAGRDVLCGPGIRCVSAFEMG